MLLRIFHIKYLLRLFCVFFIGFLSSPSNIIFSQGCNTNVTICTPGVAGPFTFNTPGPSVSTCLDFIGPNYAYIVLYITQSGPLEILINVMRLQDF